MKGVFIFVGIASAAFMFTKGAEIGAGPRFDYDSATMEERKVWMEKHGDTFRRASRFFLPSGGGPMSASFHFDKAEAFPNSKELVLSVRVKMPRGAYLSAPPPSEYMPKTCRGYVRTSLYKNDVRVTWSFRNQDTNTELMRVFLTPTECDRQLARAKTA